MKHGLAPATLSSTGYENLKIPLTARLAAKACNLVQTISRCFDELYCRNRLHPLQATAGKRLRPYLAGIDLGVCCDFLQKTYFERLAFKTEHSHDPPT
jgi:hypothetical protein